MFPVYPVLASFVHTSELDFYRWDTDETSILSIHEWTASTSDEHTLVESKDSYLSVSALVDDDLTKTNTIIEYKVQEWDTLELIAKKYWISTDTILWASNLPKAYKAKKWDTLKFPPVTGVVYSVLKWDALNVIAKRYWISEQKIIEQNNIVNKTLVAGKKIVIPWWHYIKPVVPQKPKPVYAASTKKTTARATTWKTTSSYSTSRWRYKLKWRKPYSGAWGNCTYYVASYKNVNWRWNANQWLYRARAKWHPTWSNATLWAIIVFQWRGYNPYYGHVWIVMEVFPNHLIVSDMNYLRKNQVTYRKINRWDRSIRWYIYVWD